MKSNLVYILVFCCCNLSGFLAQEPVAAQINEVPHPVPIIVNMAEQSVDGEPHHQNPPAVPIQQVPQPQPVVPQQPEPLAPQVQPVPISRQAPPPPHQPVVSVNDHHFVGSNIVPPVQTDERTQDGGIARQGPLPEMDVPDEDYRKAHEHMHLFDDHHEHQQHDSERHDDHEHDHDDDVDDTLVNEWSDHMDDFIPDMLVTFPLSPFTDEYFYQEVGPNPTLIRGGYFVAGDNSTGPIHFSVLDPKGEVEMQWKRSEGLFHFVSKSPGTYAFCLSNSNWISKKTVTFVIGAGNETTLSIEHVNNANDNVMVVARMLRDIHSESQYLWARQRSQMRTVQSSHSRTFWFSIFELVAICLMTSVQIYLLKGLVSNKRFF